MSQGQTLHELPSLFSRCSSGKKCAAADGMWVVFVHLAPALVGELPATAGVHHAQRLSRAKAQSIAREGAEYSSHQLTT